MLPAASGWHAGTLYPPSHALNPATYLRVLRSVRSVCRVSAYPADEAPETQGGFRMSQQEYEQRMSALERANFVRVNRSAVRRGLRSGDLTITDALKNPYVITMRVADVLEWVPRFGSHRARRALQAAGVSEYAYVGRITDRQVAVLSEWVA